MHEDCIYKEVCKTECKNLCIRYSEMSYLLQTSNLPKSQWGFHKLFPDECDVPAFEKLADIQMNIKQFVDEGNILYLYSKQVGNGKTTWTVKMLLQYFNEIWAGNGFNKRGLFINVPTFLNKTKQVISKPDKEFDELRSIIPDIDLVIFDDITATKMSNYDYTTLLSLIDQRVFQQKCCIFTGNIPKNNLSENVGDRIASRICSGTIIELKGQDMRV